MPAERFWLRYWTKRPLNSSVWACAKASACSKSPSAIAAVMARCSPTIFSRCSSRPCGGFFDSSMDRVAELLVFSGMAVGMASRADPEGVLLVCWALTGSVMTSYTRARAERHLAHFSVGLMERGERLGLMILGALTGFLELALWVVAIGATVTSLQRVVVARRLLRELDRTGRDPTAVETPPGVS